MGRKETRRSTRERKEIEGEEVEGRGVHLQAGEVQVGAHDIRRSRFHEPNLGRQGIVFKIGREHILRS